MVFMSSFKGGDARKLVILSVAIAWAAMPSLAAPSIAAQGVKNAASFADPRLPGGSGGPRLHLQYLRLRHGSHDYRLCQQFASSHHAQRYLDQRDGERHVGTMLDALTSAGQVAAILPSTTPAGTGTITVSYNGSASATAPITVVASSPGIFSVNQQGNGTGVILYSNSNPSSPRPRSKRARPWSLGARDWAPSPAPITPLRRAATCMGSQRPSTSGGWRLRPYMRAAPVMPARTRSTLQFPWDLPAAIFRYRSR